MISLPDHLKKDFFVRLPLNIQILGLPANSVNIIPKLQCTSNDFTKSELNSVAFFVDFFHEQKLVYNNKNFCLGKPQKNFV